MTKPKVAVLGTGMVGQAFVARLAQLEYDIYVGARSSSSDSLAFAADIAGVTTGSYEEVAARADLVINATNGRFALEAIGQAGVDNLLGKTLLDVTNELVPVEGGFPRPVASPDNSLGKRIQDSFPEVRVVKSLNTMNCQVMVDPSLVPGDHVVFLSGDDASAKAEVAALLGSFGWREPQMVDLGGIDTAAGTEMAMQLWMSVRIARGTQSAPFNWAINAL